VMAQFRLALCWADADIPALLIQEIRAKREELLHSENKSGKIYV
jgi:hypothetical protein